MSTKTVSREIRLVSRPAGLPCPHNFSLDSVDIEPLKPNEVLVKNLFISVDPYMRGRMKSGKSYVPPFEIGKALTGGAVGEVIESTSDMFSVGDKVSSFFGWREYFKAPPESLQKLDGTIAPLSVYLGVLGMTGMTAWAGLNLVDVKAGDTIYISGAAGAVGSTAGQLAKIRGCTVIGSAGGAEKVEFLLKECGFDAAFDYKSGAILPQLTKAAPDGIDVYFDNVGGEALEAALTSLRVHGRIICCGGISMYNDENLPPGPTNLFNMVTKRLTMKGLIVSDFLCQQAEFAAEVGGFYRDGKLVNKETVVTGIEIAVSAFIGLFHGSNTGKMVVAID